MVFTVAILAARSSVVGDMAQGAPARVAVWLSPHGEDNTVRDLCFALEPWARQLCVHAATLYSSTDMATGIDLTLLRLNSHMLGALIRIDPRGGYFAQEHIEKTLIGITAPEELLKLLETAKETLEAGSILEVIGKMAYHIRVMLAHVRHIYDSFIPCEEKPHPLQPLFSIMTQSSLDISALRRCY